MLKTNFLGMELPNPVMIAAGPWNRDGKRIKESLEAGAGAVVTESIISDTMLDVRPRIASDSLGAENIRMYSDIQIEEKQAKAEKRRRPKKIQLHTKMRVRKSCGHGERIGEMF